MAPSTISDAPAARLRHAGPPIAGAGYAEGEQAAATAVAQAVDGLEGTTPSVVFAFPDGGLDAHQQLRQAKASAAGAPVAGMTAGGAIGAAPLRRGCAAVAFGGDVQAAVGVSRRASRNPREAGREAVAAAAGELTEPEGGNLLIVLLVDTVSGDQSEAVAGAYEAAGPKVPLVGGAAAGASAWQLGGGEARRDSVVAVALRSPRPIGVGHAHGCSPCASPSVVTRAAGLTLAKLDGRPAGEVYLEKLGRGGESPSDEEFAELAAAHPLAQPELSGDVRLRYVLGRSPGGGLACASPIPANAAVEFTRQSPEAIVSSTWTAVSNALEPLEGRPARAALVFDCAGRRQALGGPGEALDAEVAALRASFGHSPPPLAGLYARGEVGRVRGTTGDRNHAVVVAAFG